MRIVGYDHDYPLKTAIHNAFHNFGGGDQSTEISTDLVASRPRWLRWVRCGRVTDRADAPRLETPDQWLVFEGTCQKRGLTVWAP